MAGMRPLTGGIPYTLSASCAGLGTCRSRLPSHRLDSTSSPWKNRSTTCSHCGIASPQPPIKVLVLDWHGEVLEERLKDDKANPDAGETWDVVRERLHDKLRKH
jgi:hypothetical protein